MTARERITRMANHHGWTVECEDPTSVVYVHVGPMIDRTDRKRLTVNFYLTTHRVRQSHFGPDNRLRPVGDYEQAILQHLQSEGRRR